MNVPTWPRCLAISIFLLPGCGGPVQHESGAGDPDPLTLLNSGPQATPFLVEGIRQPRTVAAEEAPLADEEPIIGVVAADQPGAYSVKALSSMSGHVVNDLLSATPISVTYCDRTDCTRVFTREDRDRPIDLWTGGWDGKGLMLSLDGRMYSQTASTIPLVEHDFLRTTWGEWKAAHPQTDVYLDASDMTETAEGP